MVKTLVATPDPKKPKIVKVSWVWPGEELVANVSFSQVQAFVGTLQLTGSTEIAVQDV